MALLLFFLLSIAAASAIPNPIKAYSFCACADQQAGVPARENACGAQRAAKEDMATPPNSTDGKFACAGSAGSVAGWPFLV
jgi:hypothetical protein